MPEATHSQQLKLRNAVRKYWFVKVVVSYLTLVFKTLISACQTSNKDRMIRLSIQLYSCIAVHKAVLLTVKILHEQPDQDLLQELVRIRLIDFSKNINLKQSRRAEFAVELFNALNSSAGTTVNFINGTGTRAFGYTSVYMAPMVGRMGVTYRF